MPILITFYSIYSTSINTERRETKKIGIIQLEHINSNLLDIKLQCLWVALLSHGLNPAFLLLSFRASQMISRRYLPYVQNFSSLMTDEFAYYFAMGGCLCYQMFLVLRNCCNFSLVPQVTRKLTMQFYLLIDIVALIYFRPTFLPNKKMYRLCASERYVCVSVYSACRILCIRTVCVCVCVCVFRMQNFVHHNAMCVCVCVFRMQNFVHHNAMCVCVFVFRMQNFVHHNAMCVCVCLCVPHVEFCASQRYVCVFVYSACRILCIITLCVCVFVCSACRILCITTLCVCVCVFRM